MIDIVKFSAPKNHIVLIQEILVADLFFLYEGNQLTGALAGVEFSRDQLRADLDQVILAHFWPKNGRNTFRKIRKSRKNPKFREKNIKVSISL